LTALVGLGLLIVEVLRSRTSTPHSVWLLWTGDRQHSQETSIPLAGFETAIPASERVQTHALQGACDQWNRTN